MKTLEQLKTALQSYGVDTYSDNSSYSSSRATMALGSKTHYFSDDNMRYFGCRINRCVVDYNGLYVWVLESVKHPLNGRMHRFVLFDVFGKVITPRSDGLCKTSKQAEKDKDAFLATFDPIEHTWQELMNRLMRDKERIERTLAVITS